MAAGIRAELRSLDKSGRQEFALREVVGNILKAVGDCAQGFCLRCGQHNGQLDVAALALLLALTSLPFGGEPALVGLFVGIFHNASNIYRERHIAIEIRKLLLTLH